MYFEKLNQRLEQAIVMLEESRGLDATHHGMDLMRRCEAQQGEVLFPAIRVEIQASAALAWFVRLNSADTPLASRPNAELELLTNHWTSHHERSELERMLNKIGCVESRPRQESVVWQRKNPLGVFWAAVCVHLLCQRCLIQACDSELCSMCDITQCPFHQLLSFSYPLPHFLYRIVSYHAR